jgi:processive 1,2-diacylglycerol beta-glucosyltransferase
MKKKIIFAMLGIGNGHKAPSFAIKKAIDKLYPDKYDVEVIDFIKDLGSSRMFKLHKFFWVNFALKNPKMYEFLYKLTDNKISRAIEKKSLYSLYKRAEEYFDKNKPDLIVAMHSSCAGALSILKSNRNAHIIELNTDPFDVNYFWAIEGLDSYITFSQFAKNEFVKRGINSKKIILFNNSYPIDEKHLIKLPSQKEIRRRLNLEDRKTILIFAGAEGVGNVKEFLEAIVENKLNFQILMVCGRNEKLKEEIDKIIVDPSSKTSLKTFGFVTNMEEFIQASDVVLGKPGASQTFEVLIKKKPIIYSTYMANEYHTLEFVQKNKLGWYTPKKKDFIELLKNIEKNPQLLKLATKSKVQIKACCEDIAKYIDKILRKEYNE